MAYTHQVKNRITGKVTRYQSLKLALRASDRMDNAYGAYITTVSRIVTNTAEA